MLHFRAVAETVLNLQMTTGIGRHNERRTSLPNAGNFLHLQFGGLFWLGDVVNACTPTAVGRVFQLDELQSGNALEDFTRLTRNSLSMAQMAGFVIGGPD